MKRRRQQKRLQAELANSDNEDHMPPPPTFDSMRQKMGAPSLLDTTTASSFAGKTKAEKDEENRQFKDIGILK